MNNIGYIEFFICKSNLIFIHQGYAKFCKCVNGERKTEGLDACGWQLLIEPLLTRWLLNGMALVNIRYAANVDSYLDYPHFYDGKCDPAIRKHI